MRPLGFWPLACGFLAICLSSIGVFAAEPTADTVLLWPEGAPGAVGNEEADKPLLWIYPADKETANGTAVVVCPGGGYGHLAVDHEGTQVARWFNSIGVSAFVLKYRLGKRYQHPAPLDDVQRAMQWVRSHAKKYQLAPNRIGVMGFSAGGHLASTCATHFLEADPPSQDPVRKVSSRPDFAILAYPVISMTEKFGHTGSRRNLLGENPSPELAKKLSSELQVTEQTPPVFIFHTTQDSGVPVENAIAFFTACRRHKVPVEMHIYQFGPHGVGLAPGDPTLSTWKNRLHDWLRNSNLLSDVKRAAISGKISVNGEPVKWGQVAFYPKSRHDPITMAMVRNGQFKLDAANGPALGPNDVRVVHMGDVILQPTVPDAVTVPSSQDLRVNIVSGENIFDFNLR